jgi:hypothetical protein
VDSFPSASWFRAVHELLLIRTVAGGANDAQELLRRIASGQLRGVVTVAPVDITRLLTPAAQAPVEGRARAAFIHICAVS